MFCNKENTGMNVLQRHKLIIVNLQQKKFVSLIELGSEVGPIFQNTHQTHLTVLVNRNLSAADRCFKMSSELS